MRPRTVVFALSVLLPMAGAACTDDDDGVASTGTTTTTTAASTTTTEAETTTTAAAAEGLGVATTPLGDIVVDADGRTLYAFLQDTATTSACTGGCTGTWPPLAADEAGTLPAGLDPNLLGTITRDDGTEQVTYGDHPLYRFSGDAAPGDTNGQGVGGNWYVVAPDGSVIQ